MTDSEITEDLARASTAMTTLLAEVTADQWTAPTPCTEWDVRGVVGHLVGLNRQSSPLGATTGQERLRRRIADLRTHGWDLREATGLTTDMPAGLVEQALAVAKEQPANQSRAGRSGEPRPIDDSAPVLDRLAAFTGRTVPWTP